MENQTTLKTLQENRTWNIHVYYNDILIDWRCGLTKKGYDSYLKKYKETNTLSGDSIAYLLSVRHV